MPSASVTVDELKRLIRQSGVVEEVRLAEYLAGRTDDDDAAAQPLADAMVRDGLITNFQAEQFLQGKWRGFTIGKYKILERVGVGGMGQVFLCEHLYMRKWVAVKVLPPAKAEQPAALGRFYREARAAGSLEHPNIVRTHDIDQDGDLHFIIMEYVNGSNLLDVVKKHGPLDLRRACSYVRQAAAGLDFAYRSGIIHRDIKPGNILIDRAGTAKILDMGLARFYMDQGDQLTVMYDDKVVLGTADYVAPEQIANSHAVDVRADVYSLGASLYYLLAGHPIFPSGTVSQKLLWHRTKEPVGIRQVRPEVPPGLAAVLARMLAKDPNARFQTPAEVMEVLADWVPADVPLPAEHEMPQLSPAVRLLIGGPPDGPNADSRAKTQGLSGVIPLTSSRIVLIPTERQTVPPAGPFAPAGDPFRLPAGPFAPSHPESPTDGDACNQATERDRHVRRDAPTPLTAERPPRWHVVVGLAAAALLSAAGLAVWFYFG